MKSEQERGILAEIGHLRRRVSELEADRQTFQEDLEHSCDLINGILGALPEEQLAEATAQAVRYKKERKESQGSAG